MRDVSRRLLRSPPPRLLQPQTLFMAVATVASVSIAGSAALTMGVLLRWRIPWARRRLRSTHRTDVRLDGLAVLTSRCGSSLRPVSLCFLLFVYVCVCVCIVCVFVLCDPFVLLLLVFLLYFFFLFSFQVFPLSFHAA